jgi:hypothetical protein
MCISISEYKLLNPSTQLSLYSYCMENCSSIENIHWNIYQGSVNSSSNITIWTLFNQINLYENLWFFGINRNNFTSTNELFLKNSQINYWKFEVIYKFKTGISSSSSLHFLRNSCPSKGSCSINPLNGTIKTLSTISYSN